MLKEIRRRKTRSSGRASGTSAERVSLLLSTSLYFSLSSSSVDFRAAPRDGVPAVFSFSLFFFLHFFVKNTFFSSFFKDLFNVPNLYKTLFLLQFLCDRRTDGNERREEKRERERERERAAMAAVQFKRFGKCSLVTVIYPSNWTHSEKTSRRF